MTIKKLYEKTQKLLSSTENSMRAKWFCFGNYSIVKNRNILVTTCVNQLKRVIILPF